MPLLGKLVLDQTAFPALLKSMDASMLRSRTIANNIANVNTPGYQRVEVNFEDELRQALDRTRLRGTKTDQKHLELGRPLIGEVNATVSKPVDHSLPSGVNNVDIDQEMAKLAENQILFNFTTKALRGIVRKIDSAIQGKSMPVQ